MNRTAEITRKTRETDIKIKLDLDKSGEVSIDTGIGFLDHMLTALAVHGGFSLSVKCAGDLNVDGHHTTEDIGIVLGMTFREALGDKSGIMRYGSAFIPMDESLAFCSLDISARPFLVFNAQFTNERVGEFDTCLTEEFMRSFAFNAGITLHLRVEYGSNDHHKIEALFKALAYALKAAVKRNTDGSVVSTKGVL
ncbi:MAG TPA: imidazoleglycerol-phosphate dehydratase HisB [Ruminococcaceae bacterium]|nr:imidazoleglycerol-phosphate dehydratase HisB [Oscillospiraceae bacterium]HCK50992.1 imidazoleglycerol-phosphate dehydratase HisB [Oscillospiraceae bacterium]